MNNTQIEAMKLACRALYYRDHNDGLNRYDMDAYQALKFCIKDATGELYANGNWYQSQFDEAK